MSEMASIQASSGLPQNQRLVQQRFRPKFSLERFVVGNSIQSCQSLIDEFHFDLGVCFCANDFNQNFRFSGRRDDCLVI